MKIPKYIKTKMHKVASLHAEAFGIMREIEEYLINHGISIDAIRDGRGDSLEELEYGNDITDELCERIENEFWLEKR